MPHPRARPPSARLLGLLLLGACETAPGAPPAPDGATQTPTDTAPRADAGPSEDTPPKAHEVTVDAAVEDTQSPPAPDTAPMEDTSPPEDAAPPPDTTPAEVSAPDSTPDLPEAPTDSTTPAPDTPSPPTEDRPGCPGGETLCDGVCVNTHRDERHCGGCGSPCEGERRCVEGLCACPGGLTWCDGACRRWCGPDPVCLAGLCHPANDRREDAVEWVPSVAESEFHGSTAGATADGSGSTCRCTARGQPDVWYRFRLAARAVVYADTAGSPIDTAVYLADAEGRALPDACNDDAGCTSGDFGSREQSQLARVLPAGSYHLVVTHCRGLAGSGPYTLHLQHLALTVGGVAQEAPLTDRGTVSGMLPGAGSTAGSCGGEGSGEDLRWFMTCGGLTQSFSVCGMDRGAFTRRAEGLDHDPVLYLRSGLTGTEFACNDDYDVPGCRGSGGDDRAVGARIDPVVVTRGVHGLYVDDHSAGGMAYTLAYTVR